MCSDQGAAMTLAASYPLLDAFWTILEIFLFALWIWLVIVCHERMEGSM